MNPTATRQIPSGLLGHIALNQLSLKHNSNSAQNATSPKLKAAPPVEFNSSSIVHSAALVSVPIEAIPLSGIPTFRNQVTRPKAPPIINNVIAGSM